MNWVPQVLNNLAVNILESSRYTLATNPIIGMRIFTLKMISKVARSNLQRRSSAILFFKIWSPAIPSCIVFASQ